MNSTMPVNRIHFTPNQAWPMRSCYEISELSRLSSVTVRSVSVYYPGARVRCTTDVAQVTCGICLSLLRMSSGQEIERTFSHIGTDSMRFLLRGKFVIPLLPSINLLDSAIEVFCCGGYHSVMRHSSVLSVEEAARNYEGLCEKARESHHGNFELMTGTEAMLRLRRS